MKKEVYICQYSDLKEGEFKIFEVGKFSIGLIIHDEKVIGYLNVCPHAGAPICEGYIDHMYISEKRFETKIDSKNSILKCPWHGYEYKIANGEAIIKDEKGLTSVDLLTKGKEIYLIL